MCFFFPTFFWSHHCSASWVENLRRFIFFSICQPKFEAHPLLSGNRKDSVDHTSVLPLSISLNNRPFLPALRAVAAGLPDRKLPTHVLPVL